MVVLLLKLVVVVVVEVVVAAAVVLFSLTTAEELLEASNLARAKQAGFLRSGLQSTNRAHCSNEPVQVGTVLVLVLPLNL